MFAVVETGGKQYQVNVGKVIKTEAIVATVGEKIELDKILAINGRVGAPYIENAKVIAQILGQEQTDKVIVFKKNRRHNYRRKRGHRQQITVMRIQEIIE